MGSGNDSPAANSRLNLAFAASIAAHAALLLSFATRSGLPGGGEPSPGGLPPRQLAFSLKQAGPPAAPPPAEPRPGAAPAATAATGSSERGPLPLTPIAAAYPEGALPLGISAKVEVRAIVDETGRVEQASVVAATLADVFDRSALTAVRATRFVPATVAGRPVKSTYRAVIFYDIK